MSPSQTGTLPAFLGIGALLWAIDLWNEPAYADGAEPIIVPADVIDTLADGWTRRSGSPPDADERAALVDGWVEEEVLVRQARQMGLDRGDLIIRRRLVQKMGFLLDELEPGTELDDIRLQDFLDQNKDEFARPERRSIVQVYVSRDRHGDRANDVAKAILEDLHPSHGAEEAARLGDPSLRPARLARRTRSHLSRDFGPELAAAAFAEDAPKDAWFGPIPSSFGLHLIRVDAVEPASTPSLDEVREEVTAAALAQARHKARQQVVSEWTAAYAVEAGQP